MLFTALWLAFFAAPFWATTPPEQWTESQLASMFEASSPWVQGRRPPLSQPEQQIEDLEQRASGPKLSTERVAHLYISSAEPMWLAEQEMHRRHPPPENGEYDDSAWDEYADFMEANRNDYIVISVYVPFPQYFEREKERRRMEAKSVLVVGKTKHKMVGHFPPTLQDKYLRLVFPRAVQPGDGNKEFFFDLYIPGVRKPFRGLMFNTSRMQYKGRPEW